ncbi:hypothetical protein [Cohnella sp. AR92]|uniref:hypothetical protein n=1 Tax=Cohnella sp. AR92 TaxID=648716 RepID=UPI000F8EC6D6|nr:hypothetical protein [Cohnella sp. AR92]RUS44955.1 hypothetical protein ELR57_22120 [Cohnella sp. AR92]
MTLADQFEQYEGYVTIGIANEMLKKESVTIPVPTMRNWVNDLHHLKVHTIPRNQRGERIFSLKDIEILRFIYEAKQRFGNNITMQAIGTMIVEKFPQHLHYDPNFDSEEDGVGGLPVLAEDRLREFLRKELQEIQTIKEEMNEVIDSYKQRLSLMPSPEEEARMKEEERIRLITEMRQNDLNRMFTEDRVRQRLRAKATELWNQNPKKIGVFKKKEDTAAKLEFIKKYEDENFQDEIKKEYTIPEQTD